MFYENKLSLSRRAVRDIPRPAHEAMKGKLQSASKQLVKNKKKFNLGSYVKCSLCRGLSADVGERQSGSFFYTGDHSGS